MLLPIVHGNRAVWILVNKSYLDAALNKRAGRTGPPGFAFKLLPRLSVEYPLGVKLRCPAPKTDETEDHAVPELLAEVEGLVVVGEVCSESDVH